MLCTPASWKVPLTARHAAAFKNALTERRVAVRIAMQVYAQEVSEGRVEQANLADGYKTRVETG